MPLNARPIFDVEQILHTNIHHCPLLPSVFLEAFWIRGHNLGVVLLLLDRRKAFPSGRFNQLVALMLRKIDKDL